jgi:hypothetical protein
MVAAISGWILRFSRLKYLGWLQETAKSALGLEDSRKWSLNPSLGFFLAELIRLAYKS